MKSFINQYETTYEKTCKSLWTVKTSVPLDPEGKITGQIVFRTRKNGRQIITQCYLWDYLGFAGELYSRVIARQDREARASRGLIDAAHWDAGEDFDEYIQRARKWLARQ